jgi:arginine decarboxylase
VYYREECREQFKHGDATLRQRARAENLCTDIIRRISALIEKEYLILPELDDLCDQLYDIYYGNFSVFPSLPDSWAINQIFPLMPLHRHLEEPDRRAIFADITCDSDGKIDKFVDLHDVGKSLPVHSLRENEEYYIGVFLVGAYQETLGDLHNLLGDTNVVSIHINGDGSFDFMREMEGDSIWDVLSYVEYEPKNLIARFRANAERAVKEGRITAAERRAMLADFEASIKGYTYFER